MKRDNFKCTNCGEGSKTLNVHHGYYESNKNPWEYDDKTLHTLCEDCHLLAEDRKRDLQFEIAKIPYREQGELMNVIIQFAQWEDKKDFLFPSEIEPIHIREVSKPNLDKIAKNQKKKHTW